MSTRKVTVEDLWIEYRDACYPPKNGKLSPLQESETRQAFFAGALIAAKVIVASSTQMTENEALRNIQNMIDETQRVCRERLYEMKGRN